MRILLIDDEPYILWLKQFLERKGCEVIWERDYAGAYKHMHQERFDLAIVDILMPASPDSDNPEEDSQVMGLKLCKEIRAAEWGQSKDAIIVYSVVTEPEFLELARKVGLTPEEVSFFSKREPQPAFMAYLQDRLLV